MKFITYLGNKRRLVDRICNIVSDNINSGKVLDLFSGSGVVAYHLRQHGYEVWANDIANYSFFINKTYIEMTEKLLHDQYPDLNNYINYLNSLSQPKHNFFFSKYYSENNNGQSRLFYTKENGLIIDAILEEIWMQPDTNLRAIILCNLIYKMSKHTNTCGVFKAYYKKFGGRNADALDRITKKINIERPKLPTGPRGKSIQKDALILFQDASLPKFDAIYCDPPYNQHQYSANYHLLEQACKSPEDRYIPRKNQISGIQPDLYKSSFCSKRKHIESLSQTIKWCAASTNLILLSYNSTSFITTQQIQNILKPYGRVAKEEINYSTFRGGMARPQAKKPSSRLKEYIFSVSL